MSRITQASSARTKNPDEEKDYPLDYRQYFKHGSPEAERHGFKTKIEQAMELVDAKQNLGLGAVT